MSNNTIIYNWNSSFIHFINETEVNMPSKNITKYLVRLCLLWYNFVYKLSHSQVKDRYILYSQWHGSYTKGNKPAGNPDNMAADQNSKL